ncbi:MAG: hypothetical protein HRT89_00200 [Lentisphaeria bacterium]|nr:hypothetical protein [Lentisphaeria bacterium]NQZ66464.1 hypothetical protein [Lentisphaeria bacterium]
MAARIAMMATTTNNSMSVKLIKLAFTLRGFGRQAGSSVNVKMDVPFRIA